MPGKGRPVSLIPRGRHEIEWRVPGIPEFRNINIKKHQSNK